MAENSSDEHASRVRRSFDALHDQVGGRLDASSREVMDRLRAAASAKDGEALRGGLKDLRDRHGWLYRELAAHPQLASLIDELALIGL